MWLSGLIPAYSVDPKWPLDDALVLVLCDMGAVLTTWADSTGWLVHCVFQDRWGWGSVCWSGAARPKWVLSNRRMFWRLSSHMTFVIDVLILEAGEMNTHAIKGPIGLGPPLFPFLFCLNLNLFTRDQLHDNIAINQVVKVKKASNQVSQPSSTHPVCNVGDEYPQHFASL